MRRDSRIFVAGHRGLVGSAMLRALGDGGWPEPLVRTHAELDLCDQAVVGAFFARERPQIVLLCAAKVGGILANSQYPADFIRDNLLIQTNVLHEAWKHGVERLLFLGSSCIYPRDAPQPLAEDCLLSGPLEFTNRSYAIAKIAGVEMCWAYNRQHGARFLAVMPTNLYGPGDNYDLQTSHVLPALIRRMHEAKQAGAASVTLWGTGTPRREFLYSDDMADACLHLMGLPDDDFDRLVAPASLPLINIGCGEDVTIRNIAELVRKVVGFTGQLAWDTAKPDGTPRKLLDVSRLSALGWRARIGLEEGVRRAYAEFLDTQAPAPA